MRTCESAGARPHVNLRKRKGGAAAGAPFSPTPPRSGRGLSLRGYSLAARIFFSTASETACGPPKM